jgi:hypothetical protein
MADKLVNLTILRSILLIFAEYADTLTEVKVGDF